MNARQLMPLVFVLAFSAIGLADEAAIKEVVKEKVEQLNKATMNGDYAKIADLSHARVIEMMGGRANMIAQTEIVMKQMKDQGVEIKSYKVGEPSNAVKQGDDLYLYVPNELKMTLKGRKVAMEGYVVGVSSDQGKSWTFVNSDTRGSIKKVFPNLPEDLKLPETKQPVLDKD